jgi:hypothetical protein
METAVTGQRPVEVNFGRGCGSQRTAMPYEEKEEKR